MDASATLQTCQSPLYRPLEHPNRTIRLLILQPSASPLTKLEGSLHPISLDLRPAYLALSYVWGDAKNTQSMAVDGHEVAVTVNLAYALRCARLPDKPVVIWADALCIDQANDEEKSVQIQLMGAIYQNAYKVLAWLGASDHDSDHAIDILNKMATAIKQEQDLQDGDGSSIADGETSSDEEEPGWTMMGTLRVQIVETEEEMAASMDDTVKVLNGPNWLQHLPELWTEDTQELSFFQNHAWNAITQIFKRPYWSRVWIYQELVLASNLHLHCGEKSISWHDLCLAAFGTDLMLRRDDQPPLCFSPSLWSKLTSRPMHQVVLVRHDRQQMAKGIIPSLYNRMELQRRLEASNPRDLIYGLLGVSQASVVVDYSKPLHQIYHDYASGWIRWACAQNSSTTPLSSMMVPVTWPLPFAKDTFCGDLPRIADAMSVRHQAKEHPMRIPLLDLLFRTVLMGRWPGSDHPLSILSISTNDEFMWKRRFIHDLTKHKFAELRKSSNDETEQSLRDRILRQWQVEGPPRSWQEVIVNITSAEEFWNTYKAGRTDGWEEFLIVSRRNIKGTCLFQTTTGYFGLGPLMIESSDLICVFPGVRLPMILRPKGNCFQLVGTCYVYGLMDGEAVGDDVQAWEASLSDFVLM
ncbi:heterokaryon incompatibility protein [Fusarium mundagurra]|uniref:Heterokaryon incompatibility protein n=1 Tax=Fusarium mundagurra TaxID=1567541 RepID=A0A8H6CZ49_9HYPO|nr:heterokaryon incompatibility protein [Fusarium mundagurra]